MTKAKDTYGTIRCNVPICGGSASGKTSLICQYASQGRDFPKTYKMTVGTELSIVDVDVEVQSQDMDVKLQLLDTGGHPAQQSLVEQGMGIGHDFCCLVYSVADRASFLAVKDWHRVLTAKTTKPNRALRGVLIACKSDLATSLHQVTHDQGEQLASELGLAFSQTSATRLADARKPFEQLAQLIADEYRSEMSRISQCLSNA